MLFKPPSLWGFAVADEPTKPLRNGWGSQLLEAYRPAGPKPASRKVEEGQKKKKKKLKRAMRKAKAASPGITPTRQQRQQLQPPRGWENNGPPLDGEWHGLAPPDSPIRSGLGLVICATTSVFIKRT